MFRKGDDLRSDDEVWKAFVAAELSTSPMPEHRAPSGKVLGREFYSDSAGRTILGNAVTDQMGGGGTIPGDAPITVHFLLEAVLVMPLYDGEDFVPTNIPLDDDEDDLTTMVTAAIPSLGGDVAGSHTPFSYHFNWVIGADFHPDLYPSGTYLTDIVFPCEGTNNVGPSSGFNLSLTPGGSDVGTLTTPLGNFTIYATGETTEITSFDATLTVTA